MIYCYQDQPCDWMKEKSMAEEGEHAFTVIRARFTGSIQTLLFTDLILLLAVFCVMGC